jgi:CheY-like chemotaxis protein
VAMLTDDLVEAAGFQVEHANDGAAALALIERLPHLDAAVVNLNLGLGPNGKQVVRALRARWAGLPIMVVTGYMAGTPEGGPSGLGRPHGPPAQTSRHGGTELAVGVARGGWMARSRCLQADAQARREQRQCVPMRKARPLRVEPSWNAAATVTKLEVRPEKSL